MDDARPGLLLPRGERLRQALYAQQSSDDFGVVPLPNQYVQSLNVLVSAFNIYVALDPELAYRDAARIDAAVEHAVAAPQDIQIAVQHASEANIVTPEVIDNIDDIAASVSENDRNGRSRRRLSETFKNFSLAAMSKAYTAEKFVWKHQNSLKRVARSTINIGRWVMQHQSTIRAVLDNNETLLRILDMVSKPFR